MRETFGLPYTQHETYYVVDTKPGAEIFLGLREDADLEAFRVEAESAEDPGLELQPERYLQTHPAVQHQLYLIPAGTAHASGADNLVLEISATPYLYTLRFYDWLRRDLEGELRPVHLAHAFSNLDPLRSGESVRRELIPEPRTVRRGPDWVELELGRLPDLFFAVHRIDFEEAVDEDTAGRFHVLNLVAGEQVELESEQGVHDLAFAETIVVPAAVGRYRLRRARGGACKVVKAFVPVTSGDSSARSTSAGRMSPRGGSISLRLRSTLGAGCSSRYPHAGGRDSAARRHRAGDALDRTAEHRRVSAWPSPALSTTSSGVSEMTHKLDGLRGVDLRSELLRRLGLAGSRRDPLPQRRRGVPARRVVGGRSARPQTRRRRHARNGHRLRVQRRG